MADKDVSGSLKDLFEWDKIQPHHAVLWCATVMKPPKWRLFIMPTFEWIVGILFSVGNGSVLALGG
ncbi:hypothetical protein MHM91_05150 [Neisseriaceae bacterium CCUG 44465]|uniref:hypothetical protein n=1 Tax=Wielerella bovis TaxID=2917790 RepID=UPI0020194B98|nr:hypothetical protein [Wielerella bovis]MCG7659095.1 hypothetical protein [Wielerella bovis]